MKFARLEYVCDNNFKLAYMRHTEQWFEIYDGLSLEKCLEVIENDDTVQSPFLKSGYELI